ncbi:MAG: hypothetical protein KAT85_10635, partial [candidate division Zixibacteria bacterium]|nr:hypothetical protein [candidate division Zixibacteria bacterium]
MKRNLMLMTLLVIVLAVGAQAEVAITVYNQDLGLVRDRRALEFEKGEFELKYTNIPTSIDP